jgi:hypothetical protein
MFLRCQEQMPFCGISSSLPVPLYGIPYNGTRL